MKTKKQLQQLLDDGFTQESIAMETKLSQATISRILNGLHSDVKFSTAVAINRLHIRKLSSRK